MRLFFAGITSFIILIFLLINFRPVDSQDDMLVVEAHSTTDTVSGFVQHRDTLQAIFNKHNLDMGELSDIYHSSKKEYDLSKIRAGNFYSFRVDMDDNTIQGMQYGIDDMSFLSVVRHPDGYSAEKVILPVERRTGSFYLQIKENLISSMPGKHREYNRLALALSDIYAWDIDFSNDIRNGDAVKIIVEELWVGEVFKGFGEILSAEFINNGKSHYAFRFDYDGYTDYFDEKGRSLKKALLRSPLKFKYISSGFSKRRYHPVLSTYRPHLGVDYAAPTGTPVSAAGSGTVMFAGYKGQNGRMIRIKHPGGYETYYGHLSRIPKKIRKGVKVSQSDIIGYVGTTGLSTGPHLDYRIKSKGKFVNPLKVKLPRGTSVPDNMMARFMRVVSIYNAQLASTTRPVIASKKDRKRISG
jgi:murein DD-endopeptidase MepM/ murein hydrolase activator NlpD